MKIISWRGLKQSVILLPWFLHQLGRLVQVDRLWHEEGLHHPLEVPVQVSWDVLDGLRCGLNVRGEDGRHRARACLAVEEVRLDVPGLDEDGGDVVPKEE